MRVSYAECRVIDGKLVVGEVKQIEPRNCPHFIFLGNPRWYLDREIANRERPVKSVAKAARTREVDDDE